MLNGIKRLLNGQTLEAMKGVMTRGPLVIHDQNDIEMPHGNFMAYQDRPSRMLSQQLIDDLAEMRKNTTVFGRDPAEDARYRSKCSFYEPGASLAWPPVHPPAAYDFSADGCREKSSSPPLPWPPVHRPAPLQYDFDVDHFKEESSSPPLAWPPIYNPALFQRDSVPRVIPPSIGEKISFDPFSCDSDSERTTVRSIDTPNGKIFAPVPQIPTAAALANFEAIALAASAADDMVGGDPSDSRNSEDIYLGGSPGTSHRLTPLQCSDSSTRLDHDLPVFRPTAPAPVPRIIPHIIGEGDSFNPFSHCPVLAESKTRGIDTPTGRIFAPVPQVPTAAALKNFEAIALAAAVPAAEGVIEKELSPDGMLSDRAEGSGSSRTKAAPTAHSIASHIIGEDDPFNPFSYM